jgi:O-antigen/teichoic acid export membrane protein
MPTEEPVQTETLLDSTPPAKTRWTLGEMLGGYFRRAREHHAAFLFTGASVLVSFGSMLAATFTMRWVSPEDLGLWNSVRLALSYAMLALAGINNGLSRDLPYYFGKSDEQTAKRLAATTLFYISLAGMLVLLAGAVCVAAFRHHGPKLILAVATVTVLIAIAYYTNYLIVTFRSSQSFRDFSKIKLGEAAITVLTIPLLAYLGYNGMLLRALVLAVVVVALMHLCRPVRVTPKWSGSGFLLLIKTGAPIFIFDYLATSAATSDRLVLLHFGGLKAVGLFSLALMARDAIGIVPAALSEYIYPRMSYSYGQHHDPRRLWKIALQSSLLVVAFMIPAVIAGWFLMPPIITKFFPKYAEAVTAAQWMLVASVFMGATLGKMAIWSLKDWKLMAWYQILSVVFTVAGPILGVCLGKTPLLGVSIGTVIAQAAWLPIGAYLVYLATHRRGETSTKTV